MKTKNVVMVLIFLFFILSLTNVSASEDTNILNMDYDLIEPPHPKRVGIPEFFFT